MREGARAEREKTGQAKNQNGDERVVQQRRRAEQAKGVGGYSNARVGGLSNREKPESSDATERLQHEASDGVGDATEREVRRGRAINRKAKNAFIAGH